MLLSSSLFVGSDRCNDCSECEKCEGAGVNRPIARASQGLPTVTTSQEMKRFLGYRLSLILGKSWACKHWKFQNNYFVIFFAFLLHFFCIWVCHFGFVLSFFCHVFVISLSFLCHLFVICLSFYCHFIVILGTGKWRKKMLKNDYHDRPFVISWQHQIQGTSAETLGKPAGGEEG